MFVRHNETQDVTEQLTRFNGKVIRTIPHPRFVKTYLLQGLSVFCGNGWIIWLDYQAPGLEWGAPEFAQTGVNWKNQLVESLEKTVAEYGDLIDDRPRPLRIPERYVSLNTRKCEILKAGGAWGTQDASVHSRDSCFDIEIEFRLSPGEMQSAVAFIRRIPPGTEGRSIERWSILGQTD